MKKIQIIMVSLIAILMLATNIVNATTYTADVNLLSTDKLVDGGKVTITLKVENINATETGISTVKGKLSFDKDVFESYEVETLNGWTKQNSSDTFLIEKSTGITNNEEVAKIVFNVKNGITKNTAEIKFSTITVSGLVRSEGGPGDIMVGGATVTVSKDAEPQINKTTNSTKIIGTSQTTSKKLPNTGINGAIPVAIIFVLSSSYIFYKKYKNIDR